MTGFEPATSGSTIRRSNQLSYTHHTEKILDIGPVAEGILTKTEEDPQLTVALQILASKAACISVRIAAAAAAGSAASLMGRPTTK